MTSRTLSRAGLVRAGVPGAPERGPNEVRTYFGRLAASDHPQAVADLAVTLMQETRRTGGQVALNTAIDLFRRAVAASPADHPGRAAVLANLDSALTTRFERAGDWADLDAAVDARRRRWRPAPADHPTRGMILSNLGAALTIRFKRTGDQADLDAVVDLAPAGGGGQPGWRPRPWHDAVRPRHRPAHPV